MAAVRKRSPAQCLLAAVLLAAGCTFDSSGRPFEPADGGTDGYVSPTCGDGVLDNADGEQCDGSDLGGATCESLGYPGGTLSCTPQCRLDESRCEAPEDCGDGVLDPGEACDGAALGGATCASETTFTEGVLTCRASCVLDTSACHTCGDGSVDGPEECDGANLGGQDCVSLGHVWGDLACAPDCRLNTSGCHDYPANWFDVDCLYRKTLTVDPAQVDAPLTGFPVLVSVTDVDLRDHALPSGGNLRFADSTGAQQLDHELEHYDGTTGELVAWVRLDVVSDTTPTVFYLYYGGAACGQTVDPSAVWDADHRGVWHLSETGTSQRLDSTANGLHATTAGYDNDEATTGRIDGADHLDGLDDHLVLPAAATDGLWDFTMCFWVKTTESRSAATRWQNPTLLGNVSTGFESGDFGILTEGGYLGLRSGLCVGSDQLLVSTVAVNDDLWHYVCAVSEGQTITLWLDGVDVAQVCAGERAMLPPAFWVGAHSGEATSSRGDYHQGTLDELRISGVARTSAWRNANHANQLAPGVFLTVGVEEALP